MIYCVEDDTAIRELMVYTLKASGFEARGFADAKDFWDAVDSEVPNLVLLDIMLPGEDGITVLEKLRNRADTRNVPVIMASAKGTEYDKVTGLDRGADDYLAKPFGMMEMVSRVRAVLRRSAAPQDDKTLRSGNIELNIGEHRVIANGIDVQLTLKEFELLRLFMENPGHVFSRESLLSRIWGEDFIGESRTVDVHIGTLRAKLGEAGDSIETVRGVGYRMGKKS
ncbi:MAG: winged helix-turn-helix domain-containing protein [Candidatus Avispirillum sp.]